MTYTGTGGHCWPASCPLHFPDLIPGLCSVFAQLPQWRGAGGGPPCRWRRVLGARFRLDAAATGTLWPCPLVSRGQLLLPPPLVFPGAAEGCCEWGGGSQQAPVGVQSPAHSVLVTSKTHPCRGHCGHPSGLDPPPWRLSWAASCEGCSVERPLTHPSVCWLWWVPCPGCPELPTQQLLCVGAAGRPCREAGATAQALQKARLKAEGQRAGDPAHGTGWEGTWGLTGLWPHYVLPATLCPGPSGGSDSRPQPTLCPPLP